ncbi:MAG: hypothetical protein IJW46_01845 [Clostridia bacterium]|nr:hypothetical protein [Clostridia bacterium]
MRSIKHKKLFYRFLLCWGIAVAAFNLIAFIIPKEVYEMSSFWIGYGFSMLSFVLLLVSVCFVQRFEGATRLFYRLPMVTISYTALLCELLAGAVVMLTPIPDFIAAIVCTLIWVLYAIAAIKVSPAADAAEQIDQALSEKTALMKSLVADAEVLLASVKGSELFETVKPVYEALYYSDPVSSDGLKAYNAHLLGQFQAFADAVRQGDHELARAASCGVLDALAERNRMCRQLK